MIKKGKRGVLKSANASLLCEGVIEWGIGGFWLASLSPVAKGPGEELLQLFGFGPVRQGPDRWKSVEEGGSELQTREEFFLNLRESLVGKVRPAEQNVGLLTWPQVDRKGGSVAEGTGKKGLGTHPEHVFAAIPTEGLRKDSKNHADERALRKVIGRKDLHYDA